MTTPEIEKKNYVNVGEIKPHVYKCLRVLANVRMGQFSPCLIFLCHSILNTTGLCLWYFPRGETVPELIGVFRRSSWPGMWFALPWNKFCKEQTSILETLWWSNCLSMAQYSTILGSLVLTATTISFKSINANIISICLTVFQFSIGSNLRMWGKRTVI